MDLERLIRKVGRTAQVHVHPLQELGKSVEHRLRMRMRKAHDRDLEGLRLIDTPDGALFLDVGANRGWATQAFRTICPRVRVTGFEPNPEMASRIAHLYHPPDALHVAALSDRCGELPLYVPAYRGLVFDGLASLSEQEACRGLNDATLFGFAPRHLEIRRIMCSVATLDSFRADPFFIKIDVQGFEYDVIRGGLATIAAARPIIFAESEALDIDRVIALLAEWRYEVWRFDGRFHPGEASESNVYFVPEAKAASFRLA